MRDVSLLFRRYFIYEIQLQTVVDIEVDIDIAVLYDIASYKKARQLFRSNFSYAVSLLNSKLTRIILGFLDLCSNF